MIGVYVCSLLSVMGVTNFSLGAGFEGSALLSISSLFHWCVLGVFRRIRGGERRMNIYCGRISSFFGMCLVVWNLPASIGLWDSIFSTLI